MSAGRNGLPRDPVTVGPYRLLQRLGEGGMGVVHLALDPAQRAVALKVLRESVAADPDARRRLSREVETLRRVRHIPVIVDGRLRDIVSIGDVVKHRIEELQSERDQLTAYITG